MYIESNADRIELHELTMIVMNHRIAGITFRTETEIAIRGLKSSRLGRFQSNGKEPDIYHRYRLVPDDTPTVSPLKGDDLKHTNLCLRYPIEAVLETPIICSTIVREQLGLCLKRDEPVTLEIRMSSVTIFDFASQELFLFFTPDMAEDIVDFRLGADIFTPFLSNFSATMVHSSGLVRNNKAALFLAPDEGGKTTAVKLSKKGTILSDDQIIIKKEGDIFMAYATPWGMIINNSQHARLGGFFLLEQADRFELIKIKKEDVLEYLWNEHKTYRFFLPRKIKIKFFDILYAACCQVPVYKMFFPKNYVDWDAIDAAIEC